MATLISLSVLSLFSILLRICKTCNVRANPKFVFTRIIIMNKKKTSAHAVRWSSDFVIAEYRAIKAKVISLDYTNNFLFLPGKTQLAIKNLCLPIDEITIISRLSNFEPGPAAWNPHFYNKELIALASNNRLELLVCKNYAELCTNNLLKSHTRTITGLNWHPIDPNLIASSSLDTFTYIWDIRDSQKPAISLSSFAAASHVKWNRLSRHLLATAHSGDVKIWDERKLSSPVQYISAHLTSIHCLNWSNFKETQIFTASQDGTVKFFDINHPRKTDFIINVDGPVWRAGYTPFGRGLLVVVIPSARKIENSLLLWNLQNNNIPLHTFVGHTEIVLDFEWRYFQQDGSDYQLITWSKDQTLRIWEVDKYLQELCGSERSEPDLDCVDHVGSPYIEDTTISSSESISSYKYFDVKPMDIKSTSSSISESSDIQVPAIIHDAILENNYIHVDLNSLNNRCSSTTTSAPMNLQQEFSNNIDIPNVQIFKTDIIRRMCCATAKYNGQVISLLINFPPSYPRNKGPVFRFTQGTTVSNDVRFKILEALRDTADFKVKNNQACLEACLRTLISTMQQLTSTDTERMNLFTNNVPTVDRISTLGSNQEAYFLPAKTCGAKFGYVDKLICFAKPLSQLQSSDKNICGLVSLSYRQTEALTRLYMQNKNGTLPPRTKYMIRRGLLKRMKNAHQNKRTVLVYDVSSLFFLNKELALKYKLSGSDLKSVCTHNAQVASSVGRRDLQQIWNLVLISVMSVYNGYMNCIDWENHPLAKQMLESIILFYISQSDIQTAASLCCVFQQYLYKRESYQIKLRPYRSIFKTPSTCTYREWLSEPSGSPYHTVHRIDSTLEVAWSLPIRKHGRSSSWSEFLEDSRPSNNIEPIEAIDVPDTPASSVRTPKDDSNELLFDRVIRSYADVLHRWQLLTVRALIMKSVRNVSIEIHRGIEIVPDCKKCKIAVPETVCTTCNLPTLYCIICRLSVKGLATACVLCGHGGHLSHMKKWYDMESRCPVGCQCHCSLSFITTIN